MLEACPDHHWRAIVGLGRYGGLRTPSETLSLRWQDIDWEAGRLAVTSPKTEHHAGGASRVIPLFPELRKLLAESFDLAPEGAVYVFDERFRKSTMGPGGWMNANLRTHFTRFVQRAALKPWPRQFPSLRASRETELVESYPLQVVTDWLGNTPKVAMRHYLMTTDEPFAAAVQDDTPTPENGEDKATQQAHFSTRSEPQPAMAAHEKNPGFAGVSESLRYCTGIQSGGDRTSRPPRGRVKHVTSRVSAISSDRFVVGAGRRGESARQTARRPAAPAVYVARKYLLGPCRWYRSAYAGLPAAQSDDVAALRLSG